MDKSKQPNLTGKCLECGKPTRLLVKSRMEFGDACSVSCGAKIGQRRMMLEKTTHPSQSKAAQTKRKDTCFKKYGHVTPLQRSSVIANRKLAMGTDETRDKITATLLDRYGITAPLKNKVILDKMKKTTTERFGCPNAMQNSEVKIKNRRANILTYSANSLEDKLHRIKALLDIEPLFDSSDYDGTDKDYLWRHNGCSLHFTYSLPVNGAFPRCPMCHPKSLSLPQSIINNFLKDLNIVFKTNDRSIIKPLELDIFIPEANLAIEVNGVYWHKDGNGRTPLLKKTLLCDARGIQLLHFWDYEIINKQEIVFDLIRAKLGLLTNKIGARACSIYQVSKWQARHFLDSNHLDGSSVASSLNLALKNNNEIIAIATFSKSRFKRGEIEMLRFCVKNNTSCPGAISKLIRAAKRHFKVTKITTYANRRYSNGSGYKKVGVMGHITPPNCFYITGFGKDIIPRLAAQKHKLAKLITNFDSALTAEENIRRAGWIKVSDSGNFKLIL